MTEKLENENKELKRGLDKDQLKVTRFLFFTQKNKITSVN